jgi:hypothetical protein
MLEKIEAFIAEAQKYAKAIVAGAGAVLIAVADLSNTFGIVIVPADAQPYITFGLAILTAFATWAVPNAASDVSVSGE